MDVSEATRGGDAEPQTAVQHDDDHLRDWLDAERAQSTELLAGQLHHFVALPDGNGSDREAGVAALASIRGQGPVDLPDDRPRPPSTGQMLPVAPLASFWAYSNNRPSDGNTCGQAAIGSMLDFHGQDPFGLPRVAAGHWLSGAIIDALKNAGYGPDVLGGVFGTSPARVRDALRAYGVTSAQSHNSGLFFSGWPNEWNRLLAYVYYSALPVPALVVTSGLGAHWPVVWKMERGPTEMMLHLGNWSTTWGPNPMRQSDFLNRWQCAHLPLGFNHAAVYSGSPKISF